VDRPQTVSDKLRRRIVNDAAATAVIELRNASKS
jgi:hypothetical protein